MHLLFNKVMISRGFCPPEHSALQRERGKKNNFFQKLTPSESRSLRHRVARFVKEGREERKDSESKLVTERIKGEGVL